MTTAATQKPNYATMFQRQQAGFDVAGEAPKEELDTKPKYENTPFRTTEFSANPWDVIATNETTRTEVSIDSRFSTKGSISFSNFDNITVEKRAGAINRRRESIKASFGTESGGTFSTAILMGKAGGTAEKTVAFATTSLETVGKTAVEVGADVMEILQIISGFGLKKETPQTPEQKAKAAERKVNIQMNIQQQEADKARLQAQKQEESIKEDIRLGIPSEGRVTSKADKMFLLMKKASQAAKAVVKQLVVPSSPKTGIGARGDGKRYNETSGGAGTVYSAGQ